MARKKGNYGIGAARKGHTHIESYEKKNASFNSAGHKRKGDTKYMDRPDAPSAPADYMGGTDPSAMGDIPE